MYQVSNILILTFILLHSLSEGCQWSIEAEQGITNGTITYRGGTSNKLTVRLSEGQYIIWGFVTESSCMLQVLSVEYTNDGLSDTITLYVDGQKVGSFDTKSQSDHGLLWNEPVSSGPIGNQITLSSGDHTVKLAATKMDKYGIEVDRVTLALICINDVSNLDGICPKSQEPDIIPNNDSWNTGYTITVTIGVITSFLGLSGCIIGLIAAITSNYYHCKNTEHYHHKNTEPGEQSPLLKPDVVPPKSDDDS